MKNWYVYFKCIESKFSSQQGLNMNIAIPVRIDYLFTNLACRVEILKIFSQIKHKANDYIHLFCTAIGITTMIYETTQISFDTCINHLKRKHKNNIKRIAYVDL